MNWYNDFRKVTFVTHEAARERRRRGLGILGWFGVLIWLIVGGVYCSHQANAQDFDKILQDYQYSMRRVDVMVEQCKRQHPGQDASCEEAGNGLRTTLSEAFQTATQPRNPVPVQPTWRQQNQTTTCAWVGMAPYQRWVCNSR